jgi:hypothetical protein
MEQRTGKGGDQRTTGAKLTAAERAKAALELRLLGQSYRSIARTLGYSSPAGVHQAVTRQLRNIPRDAADALRTQELERLDVMLEANMAALLQGDLDVTLNLLRITRERARLTGLYDVDSSGEHQDLKVALQGFLRGAQAAAAEAGVGMPDLDRDDVED